MTYRGPAEVMNRPRITHARRRPRRTPSWWRDAIGVLCWVTVLVVVALWVSGRGFQNLLSGPADLLTSLGRLSGLVAADLLLVQVFLMARVPMIERSYGQDELARRHRLVGFWSFNLLLLHIGLILVGYTLRDHNDLVHETWSVVTTYGGMLLATAATLALTLVVVTSVRAARRALRYESWHLLHLYAYLGVGLSIPHEIWTGADFTTSALARTYWWSVYGVALGAILLYRVALPLWRTLRHGLTVREVIPEAPGVVTVLLGGRGLHRMPVQAGQYFVFRFLDGPGWSRGNPYSLSASPAPDRLRVTAKTAGDGGSRLARVRPGTRVAVEGPYGRLTAERRVTERVAMFACGIGITPLRALLEELSYAPGDAVLVYRAHDAGDLVFREELEHLARVRGITVHYLLGPRIQGRKSWLPVGAEAWSDEDAVRRAVPELELYDVYVCGPDRWMDALCAAVLTAGLPAGQLHQERFSW
ncbi:ferric reductase-like transmembrane domain-containing protein [Kribbella solani]|uniref:ferredoxin reductase family protein n=1 Tax=Kribbella solani TaxID=236067 RepID=UPI0029B5E015|nr:ferric reductase-like transmembrane domain-containing protein [Kribbella solani]MDX2969219.1 ferric reductase-like transmembrane domain-containing protein [Kribbella solani]MDX3006332.1 ferric reductase-like transmembrane domain-containing protein [Kribbella solani]